MREPLPAAALPITDVGMATGAPASKACKGSSPADDSGIATGAPAAGAGNSAPKSNSLAVASGAADMLATGAAALCDGNCVGGCMSGETCGLGAPVAGTAVTPGSTACSR